jgi:hypothetical protein
LENSKNKIITLKERSIEGDICRENQNKKLDFGHFKFKIPSRYSVGSFKQLLRYTSQEFRDMFRLDA